MSRYAAEFDKLIGAFAKKNAISTAAAATRLQAALRGRAARMPPSMDRALSSMGASQEMVAAALEGLLVASPDGRISLATCRALLHKLNLNPAQATWLTAAATEEAAAVLRRRMTGPFGRSDSSTANATALETSGFDCCSARKMELSSSAEEAEQTAKASRVLDSLAAQASLRDLLASLASLAAALEETLLAAPPQAATALFFPSLAAREELCRWIEGAAHSLDVCIYTLSDKRVAEAILEVSHRDGRELLCVHNPSQLPLQAPKGEGACSAVMPACAIFRYTNVGSLCGSSRMT